MAAVVAVFASTHRAAATETVRQTSAAGPPDCGSITWWTGTPPRIHRRVLVLDVASPPLEMATTSPRPIASA
jgi:hypothetical protein